MALPVNGSTHPIPAYYSFIDPEMMKGWVGLVGWPVANGLPTLMVTHQLQVERRTGKVRRSETDVLPLCYATNIHGRRHRCKKTFLRFFSVLVTYLRFLTCFYFPNVFRLKKTLAKFRAASRLTRSTFKITATKYRPMIFLLHVEWPEMPPYKLLLNYYVWRMFEWHILSCLEGHFLDIRRGVELL